MDGDQPLALDDFLVWCQAALALESAPEPGSRFKADLDLDDLELFSFLIKFQQLVECQSTVRPDVYANVDTVRDLYLYYLKIMSMPKG